MTTTYKVKGLYGKFTPCEFILDAEGLERWTNEKAFVIESVEEYTPTIRYRTAEGCERCQTDEYVPHYSCMYQGKAIGHSASHCTANACY
jgi:hypothetical protein